MFESILNLSLMADHSIAPLHHSWQVQSVFESILNWTAFGVRVKESDIEKLPEVSVCASCPPPPTVLT